jgi:Tfp pilus assembly protein FimT
LVKAFTLVELLAVVLIVVLIAGVSSGVYLTGVKHRRVEKAARELVLACKYGRVVAVEYQLPCKLVLDKDESRFFLTFSRFDRGEVANEIISNRYTQPLELEGEVTFEAVAIHSAVGEMADEEEQKGYVTFLPSGSCDSAVIRVGDGKHRYTVSLNGSTGRATMHPGDKTEIREALDLDE